MNMIKNLRIFFKILLIIINIVIFIIVLGVVMNSGIDAQHNLLEEITEKRFTLYEKSTQLLKVILTQDRSFEKLLLESKDGIKPEQGNAFKERTKVLLDPEMDDLEVIKGRSDIKDEEVKIFSDVFEELKKYRQTSISITTIGQLGGESALLALIDQARRASDNIRLITNKLQEYESLQINEIKMSASEQLDRQRWFFGIICFISIIVPLVISFFISQTIVTPIKRLETYSQEVANGNLKYSCNIQSKDEMGKLSDYFNMVVNYIKGFISNIKETQGNNMELKNKLIAGTTETYAAVTEISSNLNSSVKMLENLNSNVESSVHETDEVTSIFYDFQQQINNQGASIIQSAASIEQIIKSIKNAAELSEHRSEKSQALLTLTETGKSKMNESNKQVKEIIAITDDMLEAINIIEDLSERTNLLSINSAIQAAHAGEAGKSFSVVANEIRKLAESSSESSKNISFNLKKNVEMIKTLLSVSDETASYFTTIGSEVKEVVHTLREISDLMGTLREAGNEISLVINDLKTGTSEVQDNSANIEEKVKNIRHSIIKVDSVTSEVINAITEINLGAEQINIAMSELNHNATMMEEGILKTSEQVNMFVTD